MNSVWRSSATSGSIISMISYAFIPDHLLWTKGGSGVPADRCLPLAAPRSGVQRHPGAGSCSVRGPSILVPVRRLGWFLVGAAGATGALVAAPGLYGRLREAVGAGDPWNEFELEPDGGYAPLTGDAPTYAEAAPEPVAAPEAEPEAVSAPEPEPGPEPEPVAAAGPEPEAVAEPEPEPEPEPDP